MKIILTIGGSDSSGGAGIQADIKSGFYHKVFVATAITAVTAQNTMGVTNIKILDPNFVQEQIFSVLKDFKVDVIKIGMLGSKELIIKIIECLQDFNIPIILDPVAISRAGSKLINDEAVETLKLLFKYSFLVTPNKYEAKLFFNINSIDDIKKIDKIPTNILFKNMIDDNEKAIDILLLKNYKIKYFESKRAIPLNTHGTGCSFSASIASLIARNKSLEEAIQISKKYIYKAIKHAPNIGNGNGPINHILK